MTMEELTPDEVQKITEGLKQKGCSEEEIRCIISKENDRRMGRGDYGPFPSLDDIMKKWSE